MKIKNILVLSFLVLTVCLFILAFVRIKGQILLVDEGNHFDQIMRFVRGEFQFNPILMTIPGYHFFIGIVAKLLKLASISQVRTISLLVNLFAIPLFYVLSKKMDRTYSFLQTMQFIFFPLIFPFYFLIYTDIFSLILILLSFIFVLKKNYTLSGLFCAASLFVRQNNLIWLFFFNTVLYIQSISFTVEKTSLIKHARKSVFFIGAILLLFVFFMINGGIVVSGYAKNFVHISLSLLGNVYFSLFVSFILFLPRQIESFKRIIRLLTTNKYIFLFLFIFYFLYINTFVNDNPFNHATWFLHNAALEYFVRDFITKSFFFLLISYAMMTLVVSPLRVKWGYLLYPFSFVYLLPYWLIEPRYYFIPLTLFLLLVKKMDQKYEHLQLFWFLLLSLYIFEGIVSLKFFL